MVPLLIKICGLSTPETLEATIDAGADMSGFVFFEKSPRHIDLARARDLGRLAAGRIRKVALTVDAGDEELARIVDALAPDLLQLHGRETPLRVAEVKARFGLPQVAGGRLPADGGTQRLPRIIGRGKALELLMTAETISAVEALEIGLVSRIVPSGELVGEVQKLAETIAAKGPIALRYLKEAIIKGMDMTLEQGLRLEADLYFLMHTTKDRVEGITSFLQKRPPKFEGK